MCEAVTVLIALAPLHYQGAVFLELVPPLTSHMLFWGQLESVDEGTGVAELTLVLAGMS